MQPTSDVNVLETIPLVAPQILKDEIPLTAAAQETVLTGREAVKRVLAGTDPRLLAVVGPCSIHDPDAAREYAKRLKRLADQTAETLLVVMRVYFEKPRTTVGWKGLINDPHLNDTFDMQEGLRRARRLLVETAELGLPAATELLEPITPQYIADLLSLAAIGARTTESPTHRQMASGLSMPVGYKNGTDGELQTAIDAMHAAKAPHAFLGIDPEGKTCVVRTKGNPWGCLILRGGRMGTNYDGNSIREASERLAAAKLHTRLMIDCSHANSNKDHTRQAIVWRDVLAQRIAGNDAILGMMLESNIKPGNQKLVDPHKLEYGVSITDACLGWEETEELLLDAHRQLSGALATAQG